MKKGLFITGTDTGVGKTFVGCGIAAALASRGVDAGVMKPAETGCAVRRGALVPVDAVRLMAAAGVQDPLDLVNPYRFRPPVAPAVAAEREGRMISLSVIMRAYRTLAGRHDLMIVEGAGGILVPLAKRTTYLDLAERLDLPVLIVARPNLGTINHTALTVLALRTRSIAIAGIVLNDSTGGKRGFAERTNRIAIERATGVPVVGVLRYGQQDMGTLIPALRAGNRRN